MNASTDPYPAEDCPFCNIASTFSYPEAPLWETKTAQLARNVPEDFEAVEGAAKISPTAFVVLRARNVLAFLDILPMTGGKCL